MTPGQIASYKAACAEYSDTGTYVSTATDRTDAAVHTLPASIAEGLRGLASLVEENPRLAEEIREVLRHLPVRMLGIDPPAAIADICAAAERLGAATTRSNRGAGTHADIKFGQHVVVWLYTRHDSFPAGATS